MRFNRFLLLQYKYLKKYENKTFIPTIQANTRSTLNTATSNTRLRQETWPNQDSPLKSGFITEAALPPRANLPRQNQSPLHSLGVSQRVSSWPTSGRWKQHERKRLTPGTLQCDQPTKSEDGPTDRPKVAV